MDSFDYFFMIMIVVITNLISCSFTLEQIDGIRKDIKELRDPIKSPEQLKIEDLEKQLEKLTQKPERVESACFQN